MQQTAVISYKQLIPRRVLRILAITLILGTTIGSFLPGSIKLFLGTQPYDATTGVVGLAHRLFHFITFGTTALSLLLLSRDRREELSAVLFTLALGCAIETVQHLIGYSIVFEWWDLRDDFFAVTAAFLIIRIANLVNGPSA